MILRGILSTSSLLFVIVAIGHMFHELKLLGRVLKACADQLARVFNGSFNLFLPEPVMPTCFKQTTIVPVSKKAKVTCLND